MCKAMHDTVFECKVCHCTSLYGTALHYTPLKCKRSTYGINNATANFGRSTKNFPALKEEEEEEEGEEVEELHLLFYTNILLAPTLYNFFQ